MLNVFIKKIIPLSFSVLALSSCGVSGDKLQTAEAHSLVSTQEFESARLTGVAATSEALFMTQVSSTPAPTETPLPTFTPTARPPETIFSSEFPGEFTNESLDYSRKAVDRFYPQGGFIIELQIDNLTFNSPEASNGLIIDNGRSGADQRELSFVFQDGEWRIFELIPSSGNRLTEIFINNLLEPENPFIIKVLGDLKTIVIINARGERTISLALALFQPGDLLNIRVQIAPESSFQLTKLIISPQ